MQWNLKQVLPLLIVLLLAGQAFGQVRKGTLTWEFDLSGHAKGQATELWIPYPTSDADQVISDIVYSGSFAEAAVYTDRSHQTPMLYLRWAPETAERTATFSFAVERQEVEHRDLPSTEPAWNEGDFAQYLGATRLGPIDGQVKILAEKITAGRSTVLGKARAIYDWICDTMYRDPETRGCGPGDVCTLLERPGGKCADIHSVFVALARASGVPAREIFGIRQGKEAVVDVTAWQHCWAEFYLPGYGWVPVDPGDVRKMMLKKKLTLDDPATAEYRRYFWGGIDPFRVKLSVGRDLTLAPPQQGEPVNYLMYPFAQVGGETLDWLAPKTFRYTITYREI